MKKRIQIEKIVKKAVNKLIDVDLYEWPPKCATFYYQPARPCKKAADMEEAPVENAIHKK